MAPGIQRVLAGLIALAAATQPCAAEKLRFDELDRGRREFSVHAGYGENHAIPGPINDRFGMDFIKFRFGRMTSPRSTAAYEVCAGKRLGKGNVLAVSALAAYRRNFLVRGSTALGYDLAVGVVYFTEAIGGQSTKSNFTEQVGLTFQLATGANSALTLDYRFCHISNANLKRPNPGINTSTVSIGHTWYR